MDVHLDDKTESLIQNWIDRGQFSDAADMIREAIRQMDEREQRLEALRAALQIGIDQADRGELIEWTPDLMGRLAAEAEQAYLEGKEPKSDVIP